MAEKIEKKISRVMRWLDRCVLSCRNESYGSALMDIECARVDFDSARDEIWNVAHKQYNPASGKTNFMKFFRAVFVAAVILLSAAAPLSFMENAFSAAETNSFEWVTPDEKALLKSLRERLSISGENSAWVSDFMDSPAEARPDIFKAETGRTVDSSPRKPEQVLAGRDFAEEQPNGKSYTKNEVQIFTLLKIGENALRNKPSAVIIER